MLRRDRTQARSTALPPAGQRGRRRILAIFVPLAIGLAAVAATGGTDEAPAPEWAGTIQVTLRGAHPAAVGELTTTWHIDVRWREAARIPVRDAEGRLVGEFVLLEDDGTVWTGARRGLLEERRECLLSVSHHEGSGSGDRSIDTGWIFFGHVTDGALAALLPDGSYSIYSGQTGAAVTATTRSVLHDTCRGDSPIENSAETLVPLAFSLGREMILPQPGTHEFSAEQLAVTIDRSRSLAPTDLRFLDPERRQIDGSRMVGSYRSPAGEPEQAPWEAEWAVEWDIVRRPFQDRSQSPGRPLTITMGSSSVSVAPFASTSRRP